MARMKLAGALAALAALAAPAACATPSLDEPPPLELDEAPSKHARGASSASPAPSGSGSPDLPSPESAPLPGADGDGGAFTRAWHGSLVATSPVTFGGSGYCSYRITLKQVNLDVSANAKGDILTAHVTAIAVESVVSSSCATPIPANVHDYTLAQATALPSGAMRLELAGAAANQPATALVIEGDFRAPSPVVSLRWHRSDYGPPLDWAVDARITVSSSQ